VKPVAARTEKNNALAGRKRRHVAGSNRAAGSSET
jgi:hypothetical protein